MRWLSGWRSLPLNLTTRVRSLRSTCQTPLSVPLTSVCMCACTHRLNKYKKENLKLYISLCNWLIAVPKHEWMKTQIWNGWSLHDGLLRLQGTIPPDWSGLELLDQLYSWLSLGFRYFHVYYNQAYKTLRRIVIFFVFLMPERCPHKLTLISICSIKRVD